jgi:hypothetical protein
MTAQPNAIASHCDGGTTHMSRQGINRDQTGQTGKSTPQARARRVRLTKLLLLQRCSTRREPHERRTAWTPQILTRAPWLVAPGKDLPEKTPVRAVPCNNLSGAPPRFPCDHGTRIARFFLPIPSIPCLEVLWRRGFRALEPGYRTLAKGKSDHASAVAELGRPLWLNLGVRCG